MTSFDIIEELATTKTIERMISSMKSDNVTDYIEDISNDIYMYLLEYHNPKLLEDMYSRNELGFGLLRLVKNQICSKTSPAYSKYVKWVEKKVELVEDGNDYDNGSDD